MNSGPMTVEGVLLIKHFATPKNDNPHEFGLRSPFIPKVFFEPKSATRTYPLS